MPDDPGAIEAAFINALFGEDELGVVVRAHIHVEAKLQELLELLVSDAEYLDRARLTYHQRVNLAVALGLKAEHASGLFALGTLRNAFAHRVNAELSDTRVKSLYDALAPGDKQSVNEAYERTKVSANTPDLPPFAKLSAKTRFTLVAVALRALLMVAISQARDRQKGGFASLG
jgi:hypothetical protein